MLLREWTSQAQDFKSKACGRIFKFEQIFAGVLWALGCEKCRESPADFNKCTGLQSGRHFRLKRILRLPHFTSLNLSFETSSESAKTFNRFS